MAVASRLAKRGMQCQTLAKSREISSGANDNVVERADAVQLDDVEVTSPLPLRIQVYDRIEQMIMKGTLQPGERLVETDLSNILKVSRGPVREALQLLERDGWVEARPRYGAIVRRRTDSEIAELFEVRSTLEVRSVQIAAGRLVDAQRIKLKALMDDAEAALSAGDIPRLIEANSVVHHFIPTLSGNQTMSDLFRAISRRIRWYTLTPQAPLRAPFVLAEHRVIVAALLDGDVERAGAAMATHNQTVWQHYSEWREMHRY
jgi:DNA-binding GntR family transcriptional regulator